MDIIAPILAYLKDKVKTSYFEDSEIYYRGHLNLEWDDIPAVFREGRLKKEKDSMECVVRNFPDDFSNAHIVDILTQLQHYECPTRMLDVTSNFLVSLFFACGGWEKVTNIKTIDECRNKDGVVNIYRVKKDEIKSIDSETVTVISNIAKLNYQGDKFGELPWKCERDLGVWQTDDDLVVQNAEDANSVVLVKTKLNNPRVRAQCGAFFLFGGLAGIEGIKCPRCLRDQEVTKKTMKMPEKYKLSQIIIPAKDKEKILNILKQYFGMSFSTLCPEKHDFISVIMQN